MKIQKAEYTSPRGFSLYPRHDQMLLEICLLQGVKQSTVVQQAIEEKYARLVSPPPASNGENK